MALSLASTGITGVASTSGMIYHGGVCKLPKGVFRRLAEFNSTQVQTGAPALEASGLFSAPHAAVQLLHLVFTPVTSQVSCCGSSFLFALLSVCL
jgi:hypothetical protein